MYLGGVFFLYVYVKLFLHCLNMFVEIYGNSASDKVSFRKYVKQRDSFPWYDTIYMYEHI